MLNIQAKDIVAPSDSRSTSVSAQSLFTVDFVRSEKYYTSSKPCNPQLTAPHEQQYLWPVESVISSLADIAFVGSADCGLLIMTGLWPMRSIRHKPVIIGRKKYNTLLNSFRIHRPQRASFLAGRKRASGKSNIRQA